MIVSAHLTAAGTRRSLAAYRATPDPAAVPGLVYAETALAAPLGPGLSRPSLSEVGLLAGWEDDEHLDRFLADASLAGPFAAGWHVRMRPLRVAGAWSAMPDLPVRTSDADDEEPVAVLTLGRPRIGRLPAFMRATARAEAQLDGAPGLLASTGLAHPMRLVSTFSLWETASSMRAYAQAQAGAHMGVVRADRERPFHHESAFIRLRPYRSAGRWHAKDPLAGVLREAKSPT